MKKKLLSLILALAFVTLIPVSAYAATGIHIGVPLSGAPTDVELLEDVPSHGDLQAGKYGKSYDELTNAPDQSLFPKEVYLRDNTGSYTKKWEFYLLDGTIYVRRKGDKGPWKVAPQPESMKGKITGISADAQQLLAIGPDDVIYQLHGIAGEIDDWFWDHAWGGVLRLGDFYQSPNPQPSQWALSFITTDEDVTYTDIDGRKHPVSFTNLMQMMFIDPNDSTNVIYNDTWLPRDRSFSFGSPHHSRFKVVGLSAAASTTFIVNKYGDLYIRTHDYDFSGADPLQFPYSWESQDGKKDASSFLDQRFNPNVAAVKLPSTPWIQISKVPGEITNRISIESSAPGNENRLLKVEGRKDGKTGYWQRNLPDTKWTFVETGEPLKGTLLENSPEDTSEKDLAPETGINYKGTVAKTGATLKVKDFAYNDNTQLSLIHI